MAKAKKTKNTIQTTVDAFAAQRARSIKLREAMHKASAAQDEAGKALISHVKQTSGGKVAYHAANGDTLIVSPTGMIDTVTAGAQSLPELPPPPTAQVAASVADLLSKGLADQARRLIDESLTQAVGGGVNTAQTATEVNKTQEENILADVVRRNWKLSNLADMYSVGQPFFNARLVFPSLRRPAAPPPPIEQLTFKSATMGPIRLSQKAKQLLLSNRDAVQTAINRGNYNAAGMIVSKSRGEIAQYMSELEQRVNSLTDALNKA